MTADTLGRRHCPRFLQQRLAPLSAADDFNAAYADVAVPV